ncbi:DUF4209 domain-containing protein [Undibacterium sp. KW1]|uniref:DUF4209 domain-containing protein n=1 Tax=Undibacterium sp. KW1 TaxID=2058624 RepID=UPI00138956F7
MKCHVCAVKTLFCNAFGLNIRNQLAHGLLDYGECESAQSVYRLDQFNTCRRLLCMRNSGYLEMRMSGCLIVPIAGHFA